METMSSSAVWRIFSSGVLIDLGVEKVVLVGGFETDGCAFLCGRVDGKRDARMHGAGGAIK